MTDLPTSWHAHDGSVLKPRRRRVFYRGRRRSDRILSRLFLLILVVLIAVCAIQFFSTTSSRAAPTRTTRVQTVHYRNCNAVHAADMAPIHRGEPGYAPWLDADNDGIACEPWRLLR